MNRTLKIFFLLLFVSSVSFVYAQDEIEGDKKGGTTGSVKEENKRVIGGKSLVDDNAKKGSELDVNAGMTAKAREEEPAARRLESHEQGAEIKKDLDKGKKGSFWQRLFGTDKKVKKEDDPN